MKKSILFFLLITLFTFSGYCQKKSYFTSATETIFSFANVDYNGSSPGTIVRFSPVFNIQSYFNHDMTKKTGLFIGMSLRNVGYILDDYKTSALPETNYKKKFRSYNVGVPAGLKIGNLDGLFFYGGYEVEVAVNYKEKTFDGGDKIDKITGWFSDRQEIFQHGYFAGIQFPRGLNLKFKYYLSEFHNQDFTDGAGNKPYAGLKANIFYFSLSAFMFKDFKYHNTKPAKSNTDQAFN